MISRRRVMAGSLLMMVLAAACGSGAGPRPAAAPKRAPTTTTTTTPTGGGVSYLGPLQFVEDYPDGPLELSPPPPTAGTIVAPALAAHDCSPPCLSTTPATMTLAMVNDNNNMQHRLMYVIRQTQTCSPQGRPVLVYTCGALSFIDAHTGQVVEGAESPQFDWRSRIWG